MASFPAARRRRPPTATEPPRSSPHRGGGGDDDGGGGDDGGDDKSPRSGRYSPELERLLGRLRPFQREAFDFAVRGRRPAAEVGGKRRRAGEDEDFGEGGGGGDGRILLADEMGLGKTVTSLAIMTAYRPQWPLLILCPASLRHTWPSEIEKFLPSLPPSAVYVVSGFDDADFHRNPNKRSRIQVVVATYSLLQNRSAAARVLEEFEFRCVIADESHNLKERTSQRCKLAVPLLRRAERLVLLSGTPALARPVELWAQLHCLDPETFGTYSAFTKRYCNARRGRFGWDVTGLSNADELHGKLRRVMVRRLKSEVLSELPPKQRSVVPVKIGKDREANCRRVMEELRDTRAAVHELAGADAANADFEARRLLTEAYHAGGVGKAPAVAEYLLDWLAGSGTQKVLAFGHHREVLDVLEGAVSRKYKGVGHIRIDGAVPPAERAVRVRKFQTDPRVRVAVLSVTAAGVGLTLTAASSVLFAELHWTPGVLAQAEDRCHRLGQANAVNVMYCVCKEEELSVDVSLWAMLGKKVGTLGRVIDGDKSASMNAREADGAQPIGGGMSAEDELTAFFAETSPSTSASAKLDEPVKGSIQSFFLKKTKKKADAEGSPKGATTEPLEERAAASITPCGKTSGTSRASPIEIIPSSDLRPREETAWSCHKCTLIHEGEQSVSSSCRICGTPRKKDLRRGNSANTPHRSPHTENRGRERGARVIELFDSAEEEGPIRKRSRRQQREKPSPDNVVEVSDDSAPPRADGGASSAEPDVVSAPPDVICLDGDGAAADPEDDAGPSSSSSGPPPAPEGAPAPPSCETRPPSSKREPAALLSFAVSKNSGRVSLHSAETGRPLNVNFAVEQVVASAGADDISLEMQVKRTSAARRGDAQLKPNVEFDKRAVRNVIDSIDSSSWRSTTPPDDADLNRMCQELRSFVRRFLSLREVEKKAFMDEGLPVDHGQLRRAVAELLASKSSKTGPTFERYGGGAKDRATENARNNVATERDEAVLRGDACTWCGDSLPRTSRAPGVESTYCSRRCAESGRLKRGHNVRDQVFALEGGACQKCGVDAHALFLRVRALRPAERLSALCDAGWRLPRTGPALERLLQRPREGDFWQADHIRAVAEGGGRCGLDNLRTLCTPCHGAETERLRARLRLNGAGGSEKGGGDPKLRLDDKKKGQLDIRSAFACGSASLGREAKAKRRRKTAD